VSGLSGSGGVDVTTALSGSALVTIACATGTGQSVGPQPPTILSVSQASDRNADGSISSYLVFGVSQNPVTGSYPVSSYKLYRGNSISGPFSLLIELEPISAVTIVTQMFDDNPQFGVEKYYVATAVDSAGFESGPSNVVFYTASIVLLGLTPGALSPAAFGNYPILGSDCFLDPSTGEGVIGPNGDLLSVNGLECLAQDLRIRILTEVGEIRMHPDFGFGKGKVIGSGQAKPQVQAQILRADIIDVLTAEPRVYKVLGVQINQTDAYSWIIGYDVMAINVEDVAHFNMVWPYSSAAVSALAS
jgi:hypothetical protein